MTVPMSQSPANLKPGSPPSDYFNLKLSLSNSLFTGTSTGTQKTGKGGSCSEVVVLPLLQDLALEGGVLVNDVLHCQIINSLGGLEGLELLLDLAELLLNVGQVLGGPGGLQHPTTKSRSMNTTLRSQAAGGFNGDSRGLSIDRFKTRAWAHSTMAQFQSVPILSSTG